MKVVNLLRTLGTAALLMAYVAASSSASAVESRYPKLKESGVLEVGWGVFPPYEYKDVTTGELKGVLIRIAEEIAKNLGTKANFTQDTWPTMPAGIAAGKFDVALMGYSEGRAKTVDYSKPIYVTDFTAVVMNNSPIKSWDELNQAGNVLATTTGSSTDEVLTRMEMEGKLKLEVRRIKDVGSGVLAVTSGNVTAYANQRDALGLMVASQPHLAILSGAFGQAWFGVVVPKGDKELLDNVDKAVASMHAANVVGNLITEYKIVGAEVPNK